jgi:phosphonate metabolism-associated iron-containing alcohol dehydrogenase
VWGFRNPVEIRFGCGRLAELPRLLGARSYALVTYDLPVFAGMGARLAAEAGRPLLTVDDVAPNPDMVLLAAQAQRLRELARPPQAIVALGGGSVIDTAKVLATAGGDFAAVRAFLESGRGGERLTAIPILAVPTTAGTGSEVTCWATVWDSAAGRKHSLALPGLYPEHALIDPELMLSKPLALTVSTGLDALSHALESLWNRSANPVSMACAVAAAREILATLPRLAENLGDLELRSRMAKAAVLAGLAFSNTKTAIAHSISYPITLRHGVAHGIACSFTLPMVMRSVAGLEGICAEGLRAIFDGDVGAGADRLTRLLHGLGVATEPMAYGIAAGEWLDLIGGALEGERGRNFIGSREALLGAAREIVA